VVIVGFDPLFHGQVGLIAVVAIFGDHANLTGSSSATSSS
jgi:hypothetical protein